MSTDNNTVKDNIHSDSSDKGAGKDRFRRYAALTGVILIVVMVIATLISAVVDPSGRIFRSFLIVTIALPIALWVFIWAYGAMTHRHTIASFDLGATGPNAGTAEEDVPADGPAPADEPGIGEENDAAEEDVPADGPVPVEEAEDAGRV